MVDKKTLEGIHDSMANYFKDTFDNPPDDLIPAAFLKEAREFLAANEYKMTQAAAESNIDSPVPVATIPFPVQGG